MQIKKHINGSFWIVEFASKKQGINPRIKMYIEVIKGISNFDSIKVNPNAMMQKGKQILYSKIPRNLEE